MRRAAPLLLSLCVTAADLAAQEPPVVAPGSVATLAPAFDAPTGSPAGTLRFAFLPRDSVRAFGDAEGEVPIREGGPVRVPIALWIPDDRAAGPFVAGRLVVRWPDGREEARDVEVVVAARRALEARVVDPAPSAAPGESIELRVAIVNRGNVPDTVSLAVEPAAEWRDVRVGGPAPIAPGGEVELHVRLRVPERTRPGESRRVAVVARGQEGRAEARHSVLVSRPRGPAGLAQVPASLFVGTTSSTAAPDGRLTVAALEARGAIGRETRVDLRLRERDDGGSAAAFRRWASGPELRLSIERPRWRATLGEAHSDGEPLAGTLLSGRGLDLDWQRGGLAGEVFVARSGPDAFLSSGHAWLVRGGIRLDAGALEAVAADVSPARAPGRPAPRARSAGLRYELAGVRGHVLTAEAGVLRVEDGRGAEATGLAAAARYAWRGSGGSLSLQARRVPASTAGVAGDVLQAAVSRRLVGPASLTGSAFWSRFPAPGATRDGAQRGGAVGLRLASRETRVEIGASARHSEFGSGDALPRTRSAVTAAAWLPAGPARLDLRAEAGRVRTGGEERRDLSLHASLPWSGRLGRVSLGTSWFDRDLGGGLLLARADGELRLDPVWIAGGASLRRFGAADGRVDGWGSVTWEVVRGMAVVVGLERDRTFRVDADGWSVSLGVRRSFGLPVPFPRPDALVGVVFEDVDGNERRDPGEPGIPGVRVRLGPLEATTDGSGRFAFADAPLGGGRLQVDVTTLDDASIVDPDVDLGAGHEIEIPILRSGAAEIRIFQDLNGDGIPDPDEPPASARVILVDAGGRQRQAETDARGLARFSGLPPGPGAVHVVIERTPTSRGIEREIEIVVDPGATLEQFVALPDLAREVRF